MNLYEVNKLAYASVPEITDFHGVSKIVDEYLKSHRGKYYMLLAREKNYYTIFADVSGSRFKDVYQLRSEIIYTVRELGALKDALPNENGALEFWIDYEGEPTMFVLFDYTQGVIET